MATLVAEVQGDQIVCQGPCGLAKHPSRFYRRKRYRKTLPNGSVWHYDPVCKTCTQTAKVDKKREDPAAWIIQQRATSRAQSLGVSKSFILEAMDWAGLIPEYRAVLEANKCRSCGHEFTGEPDLTIEHFAAPRFVGDWAREHHRNLVLMCKSCNNTKNDGDFSKWLDEQEEARQTVNAMWTATPHDEKTGELTLF